jgi:hypothetical protein
MTHALAASQFDPLKGIGIAVDTGLAMRSLLSPAASAWGVGLHPTLDIASTVTSLNELRRPYDMLAALPAYEPFKGTISSLASASGLATSVRAATLPSVGAITAVDGIHAAFRATDILGSLDTARAFQSVVPSLLASTRCVYGLEASFSALTAYGSGALHPALGSAFTDIAGLDAVRESISSLASSAFNSWERISANPSAFSATSLRVAKTPAVELYTATQAAAAVTLPVSQLPSVDSEIEEILSDADNSFEQRLSALDQNLVEAYRGGITAVERGGPDWRRQAMVSFRELSTHVLHKLAPDRSVLKLAPEETDDRGRPTRDARLRYVFAQVAGGELTAFFECDLKAGVALFELLNAGTHRLTSKATPEQFRYIKARTVGLLAAMLEAQGY